MSLDDEKGEGPDDEAAEDFSLGHGITAEAVYREGTGIRQAVIDRGMLMAELTIPSVFPPVGYEVGQDLPGNNQSLAAAGVNSLAAALLLIAFPPPPLTGFRWKVLEYKMADEIKQDPEYYTTVQLGLSRLAIEQRDILRGTPVEAAYVGYCKALIVIGNALWKHVTLHEPTYWLPDCYTVKRTSGGFPLRTIHEENVTFDTLSEKHKEQIREIMPEADCKKSDGKPKADFEMTVTIYSVSKFKPHESGNLHEGSWCYWQEYKGQMLEGTQVETDFQSPCMWPGWMIPVFGKDWGRSYCDEVYGDLYSLEANSSALNDGAAAAALSLIFVKPGQTSLKSIKEARNLSTLPGNAEDVSMFRTEKTGDYQFVAAHLESIVRRVQTAFLMQASVQRSGERVTAEEIRRLGQDLDKALGGTYTYMAAGNQGVIVPRALSLASEAHEDLLSIPMDVVQLQVLTGVDSLGNSTEFDDLTEWATAGRAAYPVSFEKVTNPIDFLTRIAATKAIKPSGLIRKKEEIEAENKQQQDMAMQQSLIDKGTGPAVKGIADSLMQQGQPQQGQEAAPPTLQ